MKKHILSGVVVGGLFGVITAWMAMSTSLSGDSVVAMAGAFDGIMAGLGIGWLIGINVAEGAVDEGEEEYAHGTDTGKLATAH
jgi:predicted membrane-bound spermidine synthase